MNEDTTKDLSKLGFEERVLSELGAIRKDIAAVDARVTLIDERVTRIDERVTRIDERVTRMDARVTRIDERVTAIDERLTSLEERVDARLRETRPIWEAVQEDIRRLDRKFDQVIKDLYEVRADYGSYEKRLSQFEERLSQLENVR